MEAMKSGVEIISTTIVKPSSQTLFNKRRLNLSIFDQSIRKVYGPMIYCYDAPTEKSLTTLSLQSSLSKTLELFYPFAGQLNDDVTSIECNDHGAYFLEAKIASKLSDFLRNPDSKTVSELLPCSDPKTLSDATKFNIVSLVQITVFSCGGIAIGVQVSHKIADAFSISHFVKTWATICTGNREVAPPVFPGSALHPPPVIPIKRITPTPLQAPLRSQRFVFSTAKLADLKKEIQKNGGLDFIPSTLETVSSLLYKCIIAASGTGALIQMVNLRSRLAHSPPENCIGNISWQLIVSSVEKGRSIELHEIAAMTRKGLSGFFSDCREDKLKGGAVVSLVSRFVEEEAELAEASIGLNWFTLLSSFSLYKTDFGWGEPAWVISPVFFNRCFPMMHSKSGQEIEVWATLEEHVMEKFESSEELLAFVSNRVPLNKANGGCCRL